MVLIDIVIWHWSRNQNNLIFKYKYYYITHCYVGNIRTSLILTIFVTEMFHDESFNRWIVLLAYKITQNILQLLQNCQGCCDMW